MDKWCIWAMAAVFLVLVGSPAPVSAGSDQEEGPRPVHVGVVLDTSGSMKTNDPERLSLLGAMIFADLLGPGDRIGLWGMDRRGGRLAEMQKVGGRRGAFKSAIDGVRFRTRTDCKGPLERAARALKEARAEQPAAEQFVIFLSDGICPSAEEGGLADSALEPVLDRLADSGVGVFAIGLRADDSAEQKSGRALGWMADRTGGERLRARTADELPRRFADILGQIRGSQAQSVDVAEGRAEFGLDGYVRDASVIVTGSGRPVRIAGANDPDGGPVEVPAAEGSTFNTSRGDVAAAAGHNGRGHHYGAVRIRNPKAGGWSLEIDGAGELHATVIQNYGLDPVAAIEGADLVGVGEPVRLQGWLRDRNGERLDDQAFLQKVQFRLELDPPDGESTTVPMTTGAEGRFVVERPLEQAGEWRYRVRVAMKRGPLDKASDWQAVEARRVELAVADSEPIDFGRLKAGQQSEPRTIDLSASQLVGRHDVSVSGEGIGPHKLRVVDGSLSPEEKTVRVAITPLKEHDGGSRQGRLTVMVGQRQVSAEMRCQIVPLTFWEKWGEFVVTLLVGLALLALVIFLVYGFVSPYDFPAHLRFHWGDDFDRLDKNEIIISEVHGTGKGFYQNATLEVGGRGSSLSVGGHTCDLEATGKNQVTLRPDSGAECVRVNKFNPDKETPVEGAETVMTPGDVYRVGSLYIRIK
mgnify:CR=1 FL=1